MIKEIFSKEKSHAQLVQRSEHVLRFLMAKEVLTNEEREMVWNAGQLNDGDLKVELLKVLTGAAPEMSDGDRSFFLKKLESVKEDLISRHVDLVTEICSTFKNREPNQEVLSQGRALLNQYAFSKEVNHDQRIRNSAALGIASAAKQLGLDARVKLLQDLTFSLTQGAPGYLVIKILSIVLKTSCNPPADKHPEIENLGDVISCLNKNNDLLDSVFISFTQYAEKVISNVLVEGKVDKSRDLGMQVLADYFVHSDQVTQFLEFIRFIADSSPKVQLTSVHLKTLWDYLIVRSPDDNDRNLLYSWLRGVCDNQSKELVPMDQLLEFYTSRMAVGVEGDDQYKLLSIQGFHCIQSFFVLINEKQGKLRKITAESGIYRGKHLQDKVTTSVTDGAKKFSSYNSETGAQYTSYSFGTTDKGSSTPASAIGPQPRP